MFFKKKQDKTKLIKRISIYISDKQKQLIIAPKHENDAGIIYEQDKCLVTENPMNLSELGKEVINYLNLFSIKDVNLRDTKSSDWPAFKNSKVKSIREFKQEYICISIESVNNSNLILQIEGKPYNGSELTINSHISFHANNEEIGKRVMKIYETCLTRRIA